jgi:hypothetical protein
VEKKGGGITVAKQPNDVTIGETTYQFNDPVKLRKVRLALGSVTRKSWLNSAMLLAWTNDARVLNYDCFLDNQGLIKMNQKKWQALWRRAVGPRNERAHALINYFLQAYSDQLPEIFLALWRTDGSRPTAGLAPRQGVNPFRRVIEAHGNANSAVQILNDPESGQPWALPQSFAQQYPRHPWADGYGGSTQSAPAPRVPPAPPTLPPPPPPASSYSSQLFSPAIALQPSSSGVGAFSSLNAGVNPYANSAPNPFAGLTPGPFLQPA